MAGGVKKFQRHQLSIDVVCCAHRRQKRSHYRVCIGHFLPAAARASLSTLRLHALLDRSNVGKFTLFHWHFFFLFLSLQSFLSSVCCFCFGCHFSDVLLFCFVCSESICVFACSFIVIFVVFVWYFLTLLTTTAAMLANVPFGISALPGNDILRSDCRSFTPHTHIQHTQSHHTFSHLEKKTYFSFSHQPTTAIWHAETKTKNDAVVCSIMVFAFCFTECDAVDWSFGCLPVVRWTVSLEGRGS